MHRYFPFFVHHFLSKIVHICLQVTTNCHLLTVTHELFFMIVFVIASQFRTLLGYSSDTAPIPGILTPWKTSTLVLGSS